MPLSATIPGLSRLWPWLFYSQKWKYIDFAVRSCILSFFAGCIHRTSELYLTGLPIFTPGGSEAPHFNGWIVVYGSWGFLTWTFPSALFGKYEAHCSEVQKEEYWFSEWSDVFYCCVSRFFGRRRLAECFLIWRINIGDHDAVSFFFWEVAELSWFLYLKHLHRQTKRGIKALPIQQNYFEAKLMLIL